MFVFLFILPGALTQPINYYRANMWRPPQENNTNKATDNTLPHGLLIFGENDKYLHKDFVKLSKECVCNLQTEIISNGNHFVQQDEPATVNKAMRSFLAQ
jgi:pimeloyl-ACP methyl ester carboxylesterase